MSRMQEIVLADLRAAIASLGTGGGAIGPSCYDTAQVLRYAPPDEGVWPALDWLVAQQRADGGWGDPLIPRSRALPTLAAVLALQKHGKRASSLAAMQAGLTFLQRQVGLWDAPLPDDLPVGVELLLPHLLKEASARGMHVGAYLYAALGELGRQRHRHIGGRALPGTTLAHSWEALDLPPDPAVLDPSGGVGHSPAATAAWLHAAANNAALADQCAEAQHYLRQAAHATRTGIPGVVPTAWPIPRFEQAFALYVLLSAGLLGHQHIQDVLRPQIASLAQGMRQGGVGFSDHFAADGDDTACALAVLRVAGQPCQPDVLRHFAYADHFCAYPGELQASLSVTAHAVHALALCDTPHHASQRYLEQRQGLDGRWPGDKWNGSWLYTTSQVLLALGGDPVVPSRLRAIEAIMVNQNPDGGWGTSADRASNQEETAYALLALHALRHAGPLEDRVRAALRRAARWMLHAYRPFFVDPTTRWLAKTLYRPLRVARMFELAATYLSLEHCDDPDIT